MWQPVPTQPSLFTYSPQKAILSFSVWLLILLATLALHHFQYPLALEQRTLLQQLPQQRLAQLNLQQQLNRLSEQAHQWSISGQFKLEPWTNLNQIHATSPPEVQQKAAALQDFLDGLPANLTQTDTALQNRLQQRLQALHQAYATAQTAHYQNQQAQQDQTLQHLQQRQQRFATQQTILLITLLGYSLLAFGWLLRSLKKRQQEVAQITAYGRDLLDSQENIILVSDGERILDVSGGFFHFFKEYPNLAAFQADYRCICDLFIKQPGYTYRFDEQNWIEYVAQHPQQIHKAKLNYLGTESIFQLHAKKSAHAERYIVSMQDISAFERVNQDLQKQKDRALQATKSKDLFLANMSHEIRTPLNAIVGFIDLLQTKPLDSESQHYLHTIQQSSQTLLAIINDILDLSKIESGKLSIDPIDFAPISELNAVAELFRARCNEKHLQFSVHFAETLPAAIHTDALRLKQVLSNLLSNAVKFTEAGKRIHLEVDYHPGWLRIAVEDQGIGMSRQAQKKVFEAFAQAETSTTRKYGGTGLGLTISARLIALLGGHLKVSSRLGEGSQFYFSIPAPAVTPVAIQTTQPLNLRQNPRLTGTILLVEDNPTNQMLMGAIFKKLQIKHVAVQDGLEALAAIEQQDFDLIFMDENMPNLNGIETTQRIRRLEQQSKQAPRVIVALTANAMLGDRERFLDAGMNDYLTKPLVMPELLRVLNQYLRPDSSNSHAETEA
ncbi:MAG: response regulator [Thiotrichales bacterium]|nr:response regulator [Thiotrichales bacterium]